MGVSLCSDEGVVRWLKAEKYKNASRKNASAVAVNDRERVKHETVDRQGRQARAVAVGFVNR